jgi:uncharacterized RDD family membrane protein YckC
MSSQMPDGERPPPPPTSQDSAVPEPDAETARVPIGESPAGAPAEDPAAPLTAPPTTPGIISAEPVGWAATGQDSASGAPAPPPPGPTVYWEAPAPRAAVPVGEGVVVAGVFSRTVAYSVDALLLGALNLIVFGLLGVLDGTGDESLVLIVSGVLVGVDFLYFVGLWTSGLQATLGMRLLRLRVLGVQTAGPLSINDALLRWIALSGAVGILTLVPGLGGSIGLISLLWFLVLLLSTATNPLRQGLHDRWARSVVVQPTPGGSGAAIITCLVLVVFVGLILPIAFLAIAGDQIRALLTQIGASV